MGAKSHPIIFSGPMIRALLEGRKTVTRRPMGLQPSLRDHVQVVPGFTPQHYERVYFGRSGALNFVDELCWRKMEKTGEQQFEILQLCPYGVPGDELWVREGFCYAAPGGHDAREDGGQIWYRATDEGQVDSEWDGSPWKPSIHMPRWASRIKLPIKPDIGIRAERLQDITEDDAIKEGVTGPSTGSYSDNCQAWSGKENISRTYARDVFKVLWDGIYFHKPERQWDKNPWVWRVEFEVKT